MKVVINKCYGGFELSPKAFEALIRRGWTVGDSNHKEDWDTCELVRTSTGYAFCTYPESDPELRTHPDVVAVVENLGRKANGMFSQLEIVEIPDDVEFEIEEYDGMEHIAEKHRTWG